MIECLTDNRNRAATDVRIAVTRNGGNMADPGSVAYLFTRKGVVVVPKGGDLTEDDLLLAVLDAGAEEVTDLGDSFEIVSEPTDLIAVRTAVQDAGIDYDSADPTFIASVEVPLDLEGARKVLKLVDAIEDLDDVQNVYTNADIPDEILEQLDEDVTGAPMPGSAGLPRIASDGHMFDATVHSAGRRHRPEARRCGCWESTRD